ncbi:cilia- and flagella-associated protein 74 [Gadus chalcogrammus]|uniref:cilia- and flagella-associated protein 74 n=1 Tax=Gadus chalcogrammus TaxID=1042646 RepID=UPI0024C3DCBE|nr:cilia- and flagella-associated protein 74 [Gadus chalcogrammus]
MEKQRGKLEKEVERSSEPGSSAAMAFRLRARLQSACRGLHQEELLESHISTALRAKELELNQLEVELGRLSHLRQEVQDKEQAFLAVKGQKTQARLLRATQEANTLRRRRRAQAAAQQKEEAQRQQLADQSPAIHQAAAKCLKQSSKRVQQERAEVERQRQEHLERRTEAVMSLKESISTTHEMLRAQQRRAKAVARRREQEEAGLRESLQAQGVNSTRRLHQHKQLEGFQQRKEENERRQESKRAEIMSRLLREEELLAKARAAPSRPAPGEGAPLLGRARKKVLGYLDELYLQPAQQEMLPRRRESRAESSSSPESSDQEEEEDEEDPRLHLPQVEPEFSGLWDHSCKKSPGGDAVVEWQLGAARSAVPGQPALKPSRPTSAPSARPSRRAVCGREPKGPPFISRPEPIHFKDFEVGKTYRKKVVLTNAGYATNHCRLLGVSAHLTEFLSISFNPPGAMSAGMSCDLQAVFHPMINQDLEGKVLFESNSGPFSLSVSCTTKKCELQVDVDLLDFGTHVVGQTISRTLTLINRGALGTHFTLEPSSRASAHRRPESSPGPPSQQPSTTEDAGTQQQTSQEPEEPRTQNQSSSAVSEASGPEAGRVSDPPPGSGSAEGAGFAEVDPQEQEEEEEEDTSADTSDICLGEVRSGPIGPFDKVLLEVLFTPTSPGEARLDFHIRFSDETCSPIPVRVKGAALDVPVWLPQPNVDLNICMFERLYQDTIVVNSSANTALGVTFEVCPEMRKHMEILPKMAFIQGKSSFSAQLRFLPRSSLSEDASEFYDSQTGVLELPLKVHVADQPRPVLYTVHAVVTTSDLTFDLAEVDFGHCSVRESVRTGVRLSNHSLLPQDYGFMGVPEFLEVQPNNGFGTLLPLETVDLDLIFSARKAREYRFTLTCRSGINRDFPLACRGLGVRPPLELSHHMVRFGATALGDGSVATLHLSHPGSKGPRLFSFSPPQESEISVVPRDGRLLPGEKCLLQVSFRPRLSDQQIREEAARIAHRAVLLRRQELERSRAEKAAGPQELPAGKNGKNGKNGPRPSAKAATSAKTKVKQSPIPEPEDLASPRPEDIQEGSEAYEAGRAALLYSFPGCLRRYVVPCFVSDGDLPADDPQAQAAWSPQNTLFLELHCPAVQPPLVVISNNGQNAIDFQQAALGQKVVHKLTIQNISKESLDLSSSLLDPGGPFLLLNALRRLPPGGRFPLLLAFCPALGKRHCETLEVKCRGMTLEVTLRGEGVEPLLTCRCPDGGAVGAGPGGGLLDFGYVLQKEGTASRVLKLKNRSSVEVRYSVLQASLGPPSTEDRLAVLLQGYPESRPIVGPQNHSGLCVFSVTPAGGAVGAGESQDLTVSFQPDHPSVRYADRLTVELINKTVVCELDLRGACVSGTMYLHGGDTLGGPPQDYLPQPGPRSPQLPGPSTPVLLTLKADPHADLGPQPAVRELTVGCIRQAQPLKKNGEFHWDGLTALQQRGFSIEPSRGTVEPGHTRVITVSWTPPSGHKPYEVVQESASLTLKGDETEVYRVTMLALASTSDSPEANQERG